MGSTASQENAPDEGVTAWAGQAGSLVDAVFKLKKSTLSAGVHIIGNGRAAESDGVAENLAQGEPKALQFGAGEPSGAAARADAGVKEGFVGIDIAHARKKILVEERSLDGEPAAAKQSGKFICSHGQRLSAGGLKRRGTSKVAELQAAETARIDETQFAAAGQAEPGVGVGGNWSIRRGDQQTPGHAQVDDPLSPGSLRPVWARGGVAWKSGCNAGRIQGRSQLAHDMLAAAMDSQHGASQKASGLPRWRSLEWLAVRAEPNLEDAVAAHPLMNAAGNGFHLGEFGHRIIVEDCAQGAPAAGSPLRQLTGRNLRFHRCVPFASVPQIAAILCRKNRS